MATGSAIRPAEQRDEGRDLGWLEGLGDVRLVADCLGGERVGHRRIGRDRDRGNGPPPLTVSAPAVVEPSE